MRGYDDESKQAIRAINECAKRNGSVGTRATQTNNAYMWGRGRGYAYEITTGHGRGKRYKPPPFSGSERNIPKTDVFDHYLSDGGSHNNTDMSGGRLYVSDIVHAYRQLFVEHVDGNDNNLISFS